MGDARLEYQLVFKYQFLVFKYQIRQRILISPTQKCESALRACFIGSSRCDLPVFQGIKLFQVEKIGIQIPIFGIQVPKIFGIQTERPRFFSSFLRKK